MIRQAIRHLWPGRRHLPTYRGRARWLPDGATVPPDETTTWTLTDGAATTWILRFDPPLTIPARSRLGCHLPPPPPLGGPAGWFEIAFDFVPLEV